MSTLLKFPLLKRNYILHETLFVEPDSEYRFFFLILENGAIVVNQLPCNSFAGDEINIHRTEGSGENAVVAVVLIEIHGEHLCPIWFKEKVHLWDINDWIKLHLRIRDE